MRKQLGMAALGLLAMAGCSRSDGTLEPGEWELVYEITDVTAPPDWPPDVIASMKQAKDSARKCITPEEARAPGAGALLVSHDPACKFSDVSMAGGKFRGRMECAGGNAMGKVTMTMEGRYEARSYEITGRTSVDNPGAPWAFASRTTGRRLGNCPAGKKG